MAQAEIQNIKSQANFLLEAGRNPEAITILTHGLNLAPDDEEILCLLAQASIELNLWRDAWRYVERAIAVAPENDWAHRIHSIVLRNSARRHEAVAAAKEAVRLSPMTPHNWHTLASAQLNVFDLKEARADAERLRELAPSWYLSHQMLALVALKEENNKEAEACCRRELELNPNSYHGLNNLGVALLNQKRRRAAIEVFTRAAKLNPQAEIARNNIQAAITRYLPRLTFPFAALWFLQAMLRGLITGNRSEAASAAGIGLLVAIVIGAIFFVRWVRYRRLPREAREYWRLSRGRPHSTGKKKQLLGYLIGLTAAMLVIWGLVFWTQRLPSANWDVFDFIFPAAMILLGGTGVIMRHRLRQSDQDV